MSKLLCAFSFIVVAVISVSHPPAGAELASEVRFLHGMPALYVNGVLTSQVLGSPYRPGPSDFNDFRKAGISIFDIYLRFDWTGPEQYDFTRVDEKVESYLKIEPKTLFLPRILLTPGPWWCKAFPNDITMRDDGSPAGMFGQPCHPSLASENYRELSHKAMIAFLNHVESKYGEHMVGYQVGNGFGGEWLMFNSFWETRPGGQPPTRFGVEDYCPPAQALFRIWLKNKYGSVDQLRRAWGNPQVSFETATPPNEVERYSSNHGIFFDPAISRRVPDYFSFFNDMVSDTLLENARWVKEITHRKKIVGAFYGYLWCNFPNLSVVHSGHLGFAKVLDSVDVDFIASPYTYDNKQIGGPNNSQTLPEAAALHGKLYFNEVDTETHLFQRQWRWGDSLHNPTNFEETKGLLIRDYAYTLTKGFGMWWTDLHGGTYHDDQIVQLLGQLKQIDEKFLDADRSSNADIAVILDEASFTYCGDGEPLFNALLTAQKQWEFAFIGAPWDPYLLTDIDNPKLRDYKLYIFLNTFRVTPEQRAAIHARLKRKGATAIWVYAPGYIGEKLSVENMRALTGIRLAETGSAGELRVGITSYNHSYTRSLPKGLAYGTDVNVENIKRWYDHQIYLKDPRDPSLRRDLPGFRISPRFWSDDPQAQVLGILAGIDKPGLVVKKQPGWTSVYSSAPILPAALLRGIARAAGCHIYSDAGDVVYANRNFLGIYAPGGGSRTVRLPRDLRVANLMNGLVLEGGAHEFLLKLAPNQTALFKLEESGKR
ncbi:MAG: beta-galactosidase [Acidobacteriia bacterium]|nr:beta-galactosidase [Terriglobia bacterium]